MARVTFHLTIDDKPSLLAMLDLEHFTLAEVQQFMTNFVNSMSVNNHMRETTLAAKAQSALAESVEVVEDDPSNAAYASAAVKRRF